MAILKHHPSINYVLGLPIDITNPFDDKSSTGFFIVHKEALKNSIGAEVSFDFFNVESYSELNEALSIDASIESKFVLGQGKATFNYDVRSSKKENTIIFVVKATKTYNNEDNKYLRPKADSS